MSNEFGTVSVRRGDRAREIELLRQHYNRDRESLMSLAADAPSEHLASEYHRLIREIDAALGKLGELEGRTPSDTQPMKKTEPGSRPLMTPPGMISPDVSDPSAAGSPLPRIALIIGAGIIVLALIGWLMWRASGERPVTPAVARTETVAVTERPAPPVTPAPKPAAATVSLDPAAQDYGTIRKGSRAVRQFQVANNGDQPIDIHVERAPCRCLYYAYNASVAPHHKETVTVTVDGAKAKRGALHETVNVTSKKDPSVKLSFDVNATVK